MVPGLWLLNAWVWLVMQTAPFAPIPTSGSGAPCTHTASLAATEIYATSLSFADVSTAVTNAAIGNTVCMPPGTATWTSQLVLGSKTLTLRGAGQNATKIFDDVPSATGPVLQVNASAANFVRLSNFQVEACPAPAATCTGNPATLCTNNPGTKPFGGVGISGNGGHISELGFRLDHMKFVDNGDVCPGGRLIYSEDLFGLVDHVNCLRTGSSNVQCYEIHGAEDGADGGYTPWTQALTLGTNKAVVIEDSDFNHVVPQETTIDQYGGTRVIFRHNTVENDSAGSHGTDSGGRRAAISAEYYSNVYTNNSGTVARANQTRGGTMLIYNETFGGTTSWTDTSLIYYRATDNAGLSWGNCDGTTYDVLNQPPVNGRTTTTFNASWRFLSTGLDTWCNTGATCTAPFDQGQGASTHGYPCRDQPGVGPGQALQPVYGWNNGTVKIQFDDLGCSTCGSTCQPSGIGGTGTSPCLGATWVQQNRDFYFNTCGVQTSATAPFTGAPVTNCGVGYGAIGFRPTTCTPKVAYFDTSAKVLYQCSATNTWTSYYTELTYPHSLASTP